MTTETANDLTNAAAWKDAKVHGRKMVGHEYLIEECHIGDATASRLYKPEWEPYRTMHLICHLEPWRLWRLIDFMPEPTLDNEYRTWSSALSLEATGQRLRWNRQSIRQLFADHYNLADEAWVDLLDDDIVGMLVLVMRDRRALERYTFDPFNDRMYWDADDAMVRIRELLFAWSAEWRQRIWDFDEVDEADRVFEG